MVVQFDLELEQMDITMSFTYGTLDEDIYMKQPTIWGRGRGWDTLSSIKLGIRVGALRVFLPTLSITGTLAAVFAIACARHSLLLSPPSPVLDARCYCRRHRLCFTPAATIATIAPVAIA